MYQDMDEHYLSNTIKKIEINNNKKFVDPFFDIHTSMEDFFTANFHNMDTNDSNLIDVTSLFEHLNDTIELLDEISYKYSQSEAEYRRWRVNMSEKIFYKMLSKEAYTIARMIILFIYQYDKYSDNISPDDLKEFKEIYIVILNRVYLSSRRISEYHLENLW